MNIILTILLILQEKLVPGIMANSCSLRHSCSGLLMLATVKVHRLSTYVIRFNDSTTLDEITESPNQVECTPPYLQPYGVHYQSCRVMKYQFSGTFIFANATQVKWSVQVRFFQKYKHSLRAKQQMISF
ncbi:hypothetical protein YC2023_051217 [Brassica napus]